LGDEEEEAEEGGDLNLGAQAKRAAKHVTRHARTWSHATCRRGNWVPSAVAAIKEASLLVISLIVGAGPAVVLFIFLWKNSQFTPLTFFQGSSSFLTFEIDQFSPSTLRLINLVPQL
jgi:hypothetical protein